MENSQTHQTIIEKMTFFLSFLQGAPGHPIPAYSFWEYYLKKGIEEAGHEWIEAPVDWARGLVPMDKSDLARWKDESWSITMNFIRENRPDVFLSYLYPQQIEESAVKSIRNMGIPCINFFCDNVRMFNNIPNEFSCFDLNWVPEFKAIEAYKKARLPHLHLPMPMWVAPENRIIAEETNDTVAFIGSIDIQRQLLFEEILTKQPELKLSIYGAGWLSETSTQARPTGRKYTRKDQMLFQFDFIRKNGLNGYLRKLQQRKLQPHISEVLKSKLKGKPGFEDYINITQTSLITLGVNRYPSFRFPLNKPDTYSRLRDIEAPMLGACYLTEWTDGLEEMYDTDNEIQAYKSTDDFLERVNTIVIDKKLRNQLRIKGQQRALSEHSIPVTLQKLIAKVF